MNIKISMMTYVYLILSIYAGIYKEYLLSLLIILIHELSHYYVARLFNFDIDYMKILPFGMFVSIKDFYEHTIFKEICVVLAGPATHIFIYYLIYLLDIGVYKDYLLMINAYVFYFNLLPIYPMDGSKLINLILQNFIDIKDAFVFTLKISMFSLIILSLFYMSVSSIVVIVFLYCQQIYFYKDIFIFLRIYYLKEQTPYKNKSIIHDSNKYRRGYNNFYYVNNKIVHENLYKKNLIKSVKKV